MPLLAAVVTIACINATMADDKAIVKLREAETALDEGDIDTARSLARDVRDATMTNDKFSAPSGGLNERATRIFSLSFIRDPAAQPGDLQKGLDYLRGERKYVLEYGDRRPTPQLDAGYGEALERNGEDDEAFKVLTPLADRDVLPSAHAYAALARIAERRGEKALAATGRERCLAMATHASICRGEYPPRPFFRGRAFDFAVAGFVVLALALVRFLRRRVWAAHRERELSGAITICGWGLFLLANARLGALAAVAAIVFALVLAAVQRRLFFRAAADGAVSGFRLRPIEPGDEAVPLVRLFYGPAEPQTLEPTIDAGYRENARRPLLRFGRKQLSGGGVVVAVLALVVAGLALASVFIVTLRG